MTKKIINKLAGLMILLLFIPFMAISQNTTSSAQGKGYTDANGDGVCDNYKSVPGNAGRNFIDNNNDGVCDNRVAKQGRRFVDQNNDGVCDNRKNGNSRPCKGRGQKPGRGRYGYCGGR